MEVQHHAHTSRKKWTHYFWEFLMLFLAVFCGFLAEYQLEHTIEHQREKQYLQTLMEDLYNDTANITVTHELALKQKKVIDSVTDFINTQPISGSNVIRLYQLLPRSNNVTKVIFEDRTSTQLKNAGGMRMVRKKDVANSIVKYWQKIDACNDISDRLERFADERRKVGMRLFDNKYFIRSVTAITGIKENASLMNNDPALLAEYSNHTFAVSIVMNNYLISLTEAKLEAHSLINVLKERYHLK